MTLVALSAVLAVASPDFQDSFRAEFRMGALLPRAGTAVGVQNLQAFSGALGGARASAITDSGRLDETLCGRWRYLCKSSQLPSGSQSGTETPPEEVERGE